MSSPQKVTLRHLKDISTFIRDTYSGTINLQQSLLGEVTLGTLKPGKKVIGLEQHERNVCVSDDFKAQLQTVEGKSNSDDELRSITNGNVGIVVSEKHVIKQCDKSLLQQLSDRVLENPLMEIELMQRLCTEKRCHPYFVKLIGAFEDHSSYCIILEYVPAGDLCNYVQLHGAFEYERARRYAKQITVAVDFLHKHGYCHLDLSLENILLDEDKDIIKLCDFGLCRKMLPSEEPFEAATVRPGKKSYVSPEVYNYSPFCGHKADIFSLGVIYFILLCGFPPFHKPCTSDPCFRHVYENDISMLMEKWQLSHIITPECIDLLNKIFVSEDKRIDMSDLLAHSFWDGIQLEDIDLDVAKPETEEATERDDPLSPENNPINHAADEAELEVVPDVNNIACEDETKYAGEEPDEENTSERRRVGLGLSFSRRGSQYNDVCEIRKRNLSHGSGSIEKTMINELWNSEPLSDNE